MTLPSYRATPDYAVVFQMRYGMPEHGALEQATCVHPGENTGRPLPAPQAFLQTGGLHSTACSHAAFQLEDSPSVKRCSPTRTAQSPHLFHLAAHMGFMMPLPPCLKKKKIKPGLHTELGVQI